MDEALKVREFWFGKSLTGPLPAGAEIGPRAHALSRRGSFWFPSDPRVAAQQDEAIRSQFQDLVERAAQSHHSPGSVSAATLQRNRTGVCI
jgi:hypothetical protein